MTVRDDRARLRLLESYERAKRADPSITQAEFINRGRTEAGLRPMTKDSAGRYFRKIRSGERTGGAMYKKSIIPRSETGLFQAEFTDANGARVASKNLSVFGTGGQFRSTFDIAAREAEIEKQLRSQHGLALINMVERIKRDSPPSGEYAEAARFRVRAIRTQRKPTYRLNLS